MLFVIAAVFLPILGGAGLLAHGYGLLPGRKGKACGNGGHPEEECAGAGMGAHLSGNPSAVRSGSQPLGESAGTGAHPSGDPSAVRPDSRSRRPVLAWYLAFLSLHAILVFGIVVRRFLAGESSRYPLFELVGGIQVTLHTDLISMIFVLLMAVAWLLVGIFAVEYMGHEERESNFFGWYLMAGGVLTGVALSANLVTLYLFYEMMTLSTMPMVMHSHRKEALYAGLKYLFYSAGGAFAGLFGIVYLYSAGFSLEFNGMGAGVSQAAGHPALLPVVFLMILGFGVKAGMFPFHGWLPTAHPVAPAPASAVLSGVITKAGVLALIRVVFYVVGADVLRGTWVQYAWLVLALITVFMGSMMAYREPLMKKRFAYSTVSQLSYILVGLALMNYTGFLGAVSHVVFHSLIKNLLFAVAGAIICHTGKTRIDELRGIGKEMPVTIWCFTVAALGLVGIPPMAGFISKWYLATGALDSSLGLFRYIAPVVLLISALLTAGYLLPITLDGFLPGKDYDYSRQEHHEPGLWMLIPLLVLAGGVVLFGLFPNGLLHIIGSAAESLR